MKISNFKRLIKSISVFCVAITIIFSIFGCGYSRSSYNPVNGPLDVYFPDTKEVSIQGITIAFDNEIESPWGTLDSQFLLLNDYQRINMSKDDLEIILGLIYWSDSTGMRVGDKLDYDPVFVSKSPVSVKLFQEEKTGKWCATDGMLGMHNSNTIVFEGLTITIIGGTENPIKIAGIPLSDTTVTIKNGSPLKIEQ